jgi:transposase
MISSFMKRDGRSFDHQTLEQIRRMAVERVREGESAADVIAAYGFNRTTIYKWLKAALQPGVGIKALRSTKATGRPRSLTPTQERKVFRWINGRDPRQYGLDFGLWTRAVVVELIEHVFLPRLFLTSAFRWLRPGGLLYVTTPNVSSLNYRALGIEWSIVAPPDHLTLWTRRGLGWALRDAGFGGVDRSVSQHDSAYRSSQPAAARRIFLDG